MPLLDGLPLSAGGPHAPRAEAFLWQFGGPRPAAVGSTFLVEQATDAAGIAAYAELRRLAFVVDQGLFAASDRDEADDDPRTIVLVARDPADGTVHGGVRLTPARPASAGELGWWVGSRLVVAKGSPPRCGAALVRAACARAEVEGALRFDAVVQADKERFFAHLGWQARGPVEHRGHPHVRMRWPIGLLAAQAAAKQVIAEVLGELRPGGDGWVGDDGAPIPTTDLIAATDAVLPSMVERDPWWAGWCSVLVNANDMAAMGATPIGLLDAVGVPEPALARRVLAGLAAAAERYGVPVLGGHTQVGVPASLSVTMVGRADVAVPGGGGLPGDVVSVVADLSGGWRPGYGGRQWDSTTGRSADDLRRMTTTLQRVPTARAAKDVSMAGLVGTLGMLAEASGCGAELDVADVPRPGTARMADWLTCFPGFALVVAGEAGVDPAVVAPATVSACGRLVADAGVTLVWPDGERSRVLEGPVVGLGEAGHPGPLPVADGGGLRPFRVAGARRPGVPGAGAGAALPGSASAGSPASASAGVAAAHEHFPAGGLGASLGQAMRAAAEGAGLASAQRARTPGSDAVRAFVGGPFPNVARAPQSTDPPDPVPDSPPAAGPGVAAGEGVAGEGEAGGEGPAAAGERSESGEGPS